MIVAVSDFQIQIPDRILNTVDYRIQVTPSFPEEISPLPYAPDWLTCTHVGPHKDEEGFSGCLFLTLALQSDHVFGESARCYFNRKDGRLGERIRPGTLFMVNPLKVHWLSGDSPFIALQWVVRHKKARQLTEEIVKCIAGKTP